ncbi:hypothetical protein [Methylobacterium oryzihabitans]|uniref:MFS transporter n=1 Tax=Methylobacterium oryzihabitans TaxID=2499852 RepID=A0A437NXZ9_9HYPH|nr:hypothetical protein [Methylobacterium oryzihabitans]RVU14883.1 hypothetical protein EOE48_21705 [Methylobacterium oryzihabitans]
MRRILIALAPALFNAAIYGAARILLAGTLTLALVPAAAGLFAWSVTIVIATLPPVEQRLTVRRRIAWVTSAVFGPTLGLVDGLPLWGIDSAGARFVVWLALIAPVVALTVLAQRALFTRAEIEAARGRRGSSPAPG